MARRPPDDPRVTDLRRYRKAREQARRAPPPKAPSQGLLGSNPRARLILAIVLAVAAALFILPIFI